MHQILLTECPDSQGLISKITHVCYQHHLNILKNNEFVDETTGRFFMRTEFEGKLDEPAFLNKLDEILPEGSERRITSLERKRIVIMVTKEAHCIGDLLMKQYFNALDVDIVAVISNYDVLQDLATKFGVPYHHVCHQNLSREEHEQRILALLAEYAPDYIVLAKYMRILSPQFVEAYPNQMINIHHSFLPAFIGASPYQQAFERGVKFIGATAHFVSNDLDEGPIIAQDVIKVDHTYTAKGMAQAGREVEESVLLHALQQVLQEKVFVFGNRTVVF